jgi:hypothetical protein
MPTPAIGARRHRSRPRFICLRLVTAEPDCWTRRAATIGDLQCVLPLAGDDAVHIRDLAAAPTPDIRRASHLLFPRATMFFRVSRAMRDNAADPKRETKRDPSIRLSLRGR